MLFRRRATTVGLIAGAAVLCLAAGAALSGCSSRFNNLQPGQNSALYYDLFADLITTYDEPHWLWIRGSVAGDFDGDGVAEEEAVLATIQSGDRARPGPIEAAVMAICRVEESGERRALARTLLFNKGDPFADSPRPKNDLGIPAAAPLTRGSIQNVQDKLHLAEAAVAYFWSDSLPCAVWYAGYQLNQNGDLKKILETSMWQSAPGFITANLDKSPQASGLGYQLLFSVEALPPDVAARFDNTPTAVPHWGHVYARDPDGVYRQADDRFVQHFRLIENHWNQLYVKGTLKDAPPEDMAWLEYYLGFINHFNGHPETSSLLFNKAEQNAKDPRLLKGIKEAKAYIAAAKK